MGYINNSIQQQYGAQTYPQFAGIPTPQTTQVPPKESSLADEIFNPFALLFLPMTVMDHNVQKHIKETGKTNGFEITKKGFMPEIKALPNAAKAPSIGEQLQNTKFKNIWKESIIDPRNEELYKSLAKETKYNNNAAEIAKALGEGHDVNKIATAIKDVKTGSKFLNGAREAMGVGSAAKFFRGIPVLSTALFGLGEVFEIGAATKYGAGETAKQVVRSTANVAANVVSFEAGTAAGASIGATVGSIVPGAGTLIGGVVGGFLGGIVASHVAGKITNGIFDTVLGKPKHKQAEEQEAVAQAQVPVQVPVQQQATNVQPQAFGSYTMPQGYTPALANGGISLGDQNMLGDAMSAYRQCQYAA